MPNKDLSDKDTENANERSNEYLKQTQIIAERHDGDVNTIAYTKIGSAQRGSKRELGDRLWERKLKKICPHTQVLKSWETHQDIPNITSLEQTLQRQYTQYKGITEWHSNVVKSRQTIRIACNRYTDFGTFLLSQDNADCQSTYRWQYHNVMSKHEDKVSFTSRMKTLGDNFCDKIRRKGVSRLKPRGGGLR